MVTPLQTAQVFSPSFGSNIQITRLSLNSAVNNEYEPPTSRFIHQVMAYNPSVTAKQAELFWNELHTKPQDEITRIRTSFGPAIIPADVEKTIESYHTKLPKAEGASWASHFSETGEIDLLKVSAAVGLHYTTLISLEKLVAQSEAPSR